MVVTVLRDVIWCRCMDASAEGLAGPMQRLHGVKVRGGLWVWTVARTGGGVRALGASVRTRPQPFGFFVQSAVVCVWCVCGGRRRKMPKVHRDATAAYG